MLDELRTGTKYDGNPWRQRTYAGARARLALPIRLAPHVALRPRRCRTCGKPVLLGLDDSVLNDDGVTAHQHGG